MQFKTSASRRKSWAVAILAVALAAFAAFAARAEEGGKAEKRSPHKVTPVAKAGAQDADQFEVPDGTPEELQAFLGEVMNKEPASKLREARVNHTKRLLRTIVAVSDKIVAGKPDEKVELGAISDKFQALWMLNRLGDAKASDALAKTAAQLANDKRPDVAADAKVAAIGSRFFKSKPEDIKAIKSLIEQLGKQLADGRASRFGQRVAAEIAGGLEERDQPELAVVAYNRFADALEKNPQTEQLAGAFRANAEKLSLIGKPIELSGMLANGKKFDWAPYKGKVVLVDFWATWCGPCMAELPNVKKTYDTYHKKGFDVIGVDLDDDRGALDQFLEEEKIPWSTLVWPSKEESGWNHPLVVQYKIEGIPAMFLVNRAGKVVSINARGEKLAKRVAELLDEKASKSLVGSTAE